MVESETTSNSLAELATYENILVADWELGDEMQKNILFSLEYNKVISQDDGLTSYTIGYVKTDESFQVGLKGTSTNGEKIVLCLIEVPSEDTVWRWVIMKNGKKDFTELQSKFENGKNLYDTFFRYLIGVINCYSTSERNSEDFKAKFLK